MKDLELLQAAARGIQWTRRGIPAGTPHARLGPEGSLAFTREGFMAVGDLARNLHQNRAEFRRGAKFESLRTVVADAVMTRFRDRIGQAPTASREDLATIKESISHWLAGVSESRTHIVPCALTPYSVPPFEVGPVRFVHKAEFDAEDLGLDGHSGFQGMWERMEKQLVERAACWVAVVEVEGCEPVRSAEVADTVVDIALAGVQLITGSRNGKFISRITARANPPYRGSIAITENAISEGLQNTQAGRLIHPDALQTALDSSRELIVSFGARIDAFLRGGADLQNLEQAWCDGAYWYHEGLAEPMDTVSVAKLETALENLFSACSTSGSRKRIRQALEIMGNAGSGEVDESDAVAFAKRVVEARSKLLHGTRSTTRDDPGIDREPVEGVVRNMLTAYSQQLDAYSRAGETGDLDNMDSFFDWIDRQRTKT